MAHPRGLLLIADGPVLCWSSREVADLLDTTVPAVNSALQRARAWSDCDIPALAALLREDAVLTMPPQSIRIAGRYEVANFFATVPADGRLDLIRLVVTRANGHPALAAYLPGNDPDCLGYGIMVVAVVDDGIASITGFPSPDLFPVFGLPMTLGECTT